MAHPPSVCLKLQTPLFHLYPVTPVKPALHLKKTK